MSTIQYVGGLQFIVSTSNQTTAAEVRKTILSHSTKVQWKRRKAAPLQSWISPSRRLANEKTSPKQRKPTHVQIPNQIDGDFAATPLPDGIEPLMIQELVKLIDMSKHGAYPYEVCLHVHVTQRGWFPYMISDICCLHSMFFSLRAFLDRPSHGLSQLAAFHYAKTLQHLQARLDAFEKSEDSSALSDATMMVIITLATAAEISGDLAAAQAHVNGLMRIVALKGGIRSLSRHSNLQVKVCRVDLGLALRLGTPALLFQEDLRWECFIADRGLINCNHEPNERRWNAFVSSLDSRLGTCWKDIHAFSCLSNLVYQTNGKISPEMYNEALISILYRLMHLSFEQDAMQEALRIALLAFCCTIFLTRSYFEMPFENLVDQFNTALFRLHKTRGKIMPKSILLWLMMLYYVIALETPQCEQWQVLWLDELHTFDGMKTWTEAQNALRAVMWVGFVHDGPGQPIFDTLRQLTVISTEDPLMPPLRT